MICSKCKNDFLEHEIHEHHVHPKFMDNPKGLGRKKNLCVKDHDVLHKTIPSIIWRFVPVDKKQQCIDTIIKYTDVVTK